MSLVSTYGKGFETHGRRAPGSYTELTAKGGLDSPIESTLAHQGGHHGMEGLRRSMVGQMERRLICGV